MPNQKSDKEEVRVSNYYSSVDYARGYESGYASRRPVSRKSLIGHFATMGNTFHESKDYAEGFNDGMEDARSHPHHRSMNSHKVYFGLDKNHPCYGKHPHYDMMKLESPSKDEKQVYLSEIFRL